MTTLESRISQRLEEFKALYADLPEIEARLKHAPDDTGLLAKRALALKAKDDETAYMLDVVPYIQQLEGLENINDSQAEPAKKRRGVVDALVTERTVSNRSQVFLEYLKNVEGQFIDSANAKVAGRGGGVRALDEDYVCDVCNSARMFQRATASLVCTNCGKSIDFLEISARNLSYNEEIEGRSNQTFAYQKANHLQEWLNSVQGKENSVVPDEVIDAVKNEFKKERASMRGDIKPSKVRAHLKKLGYSKYFEHVYLITVQLNGLPPAKISRELEAKLKSMFNMIQQPFLKHRPPERKNFLSYPYFLYKFCQLLGHDELLKYFPLLKSTTKLRATDELWKKICQELDWEFIPSV